jgi:hypothetical protein
MAKLRFDDRNRGKRISYSVSQYSAQGLEWEFSGDRIDHCFMSDELKTLKGIDWIRKREAVPRETATYAFNQDASRVVGGARADGTSNLQHWFGGTYDVEVTEDIVGLGSYGRTLTLLYEIEPPDEDEREQDAAMRESWTPRFRR